MRDCALPSSCDCWMAVEFMSAPVPTCLSPTWTGWRLRGAPRKAANKESDNTRYLPALTEEMAYITTKNASNSVKGIKNWSRRQKIPGERLLSCDKIFFPINTGSHWQLLIISPKVRTIEMLDSMNGGASRWFNIAREWLQMELGSKYDAAEWKELDSKSSMQNNMNDCGVFTCFNALASAKGVDFSEVKQSNMQEARRIMVAVLLNGGFHGDWEL